MQLRAEPGDPRDHPSSRAWQSLGNFPPTTVESLSAGKGSYSHKSEIYRLETHDFAVVAKRGRSDALQIERVVYQEVLPSTPVPAVRYFGMAEDSDPTKAWLFVEWISGQQYSPGLPEHREIATKWVATLHATSAAHGLSTRLPRIALARYERFLDLGITAISAGLRNPKLNQSDVEQLNVLLATLNTLRKKWVEIERECAVYPLCVTHGDFIGKNAVVRREEGAPKLYVYDWEAAGWGLPAEDLAGLDPSLYHELVGRTWPELSIENVRRLFQLGMVLQAIALIHPTSKGLEHEWLGTTLDQLADYQAQLEESAECLGWR